MSPIEGRQAHILLAEDEELDIELVVNAFKKGKVANQLSVVRNGAEVLKYLKREDEYAESIRPDLILLDLNMPIMSGREALEKIKKLEEFKRVPVLILTSSEIEEDIVKSYDLGAAGYLRKPVGLNELKRVVQIVEDFWFSLVILPPK